jgi:hypothetical protein
MQPPPSSLPASPLEEAADEGDIGELNYEHALAVNDEPCQQQQQEPPPPLLPIGLWDMSCSSLAKRMSGSVLLPLGPQISRPPAEALQQAGKLCLTLPLRCQMCVSAVWQAQAGGGGYILIQLTMQHTTSAVAKEESKRQVRKQAQWLDAQMLKKQGGLWASWMQLACPRRSGPRTDGGRA